ncbi:MAG: trehalose-phosphatase, partial [Casimicrobiaceae bacterium]
QEWAAALGRCGDLVTAGAWLEEKRYSLSLHYRGAPDREAARRAIHRCVDTLAPAPRVIDGKAVVNLLPAQAPDKGVALRELIEATHSRCALYVGDDVTDEAVFALELPGVVTVRVEPSAASRAALFLHDQGEVLALMRHIARQ